MEGAEWDEETGTVCETAEGYDETLTIPSDVGKVMFAFVTE